MEVHQECNKSKYWYRLEDNFVCNIFCNFPEIWAWIRTLFIAVLIIFGWRLSTRIADRASHRSEIRNFINEIMELINKVKSGLSDLQRINPDCQERKTRSMMIFSYIGSVNVHLGFLKKYDIKIENEIEIMEEFLHNATYDIENTDRWDPQNLYKVSKLERIIRVKLEEAFFEKHKNLK